MENVDILIKELNKFSSTILTKNPPIENKLLIDNFEQQYNISLPKDYKDFLRKINGFSLMGDEVYGMFGKEEKKESLERVYYREHFLVNYPQFQYIIPFSPDGGGNFYCFNTKSITENGNACEIVFWASNNLYKNESELEVVNSSFVDFANEVIIGWTLEEYDYYGNPH